MTGEWKKMSPIRKHDHSSAVAVGFTLIEIMVVIVILGILATIVIPHFTTASDESRDAAVRSNLKTVRGQLQLYSAEHNSDFPDLASFEDQMTLASNVDGETAAIGTDGYPFGPYIKLIPLNPFAETRTVTAGEVETSAWYYNEATGDFRANDSAETREY